MKFLTCAAVTAGTAVQITAANCWTLLNQLKRIGYFEIPQTAVLGDATTILNAATWTALQAASGITKMILPKMKVYEPDLAGTEPVTVGSNDNTTPDGITIIRGQSIPKLTAKYTGLSPQQYSDFEDLLARGNASADFDTLGGVLFCGDRQLIIGKDFKPIPFHALFIGDPMGLKLYDLTQFNLQLELLKGWYRDALVVDLNFNHNVL